MFSASCVRRRILIIWILLRPGTWGSAAATQTPFSACGTAEHLAGTCVPVDQCRRITWLLTEYHEPYPQHVIDFLRANHCGTHAGKPHTCCANYDINWNQPTYQPPYQPNNQQGFIVAPQPFADHQSLLQQPHQNYDYNNPQWPVSPPSPPPAIFNPQSFGTTLLDSMPCGQFTGRRISNGESVELSEYPWMALLEYAGQKHSSRRFRCAGSLITDRYILTAAHCVNQRDTPISIRLGEHDLERHEDCEKLHKKHDLYEYCAPPVVDVAVEEVIRHPQFQTQPLSNDIALIRLRESVQFQVHIRPICLARSQADNLPPWLTIAGWGLTEQGYASDILMKANIPLLNSNVCEQRYRNALPMALQLICAGSNDRQGTCKGDSGGPLFGVKNFGYTDVRYIQYGIVSAGAAACGDSQNLPGVFMRVAAYMDWIAANLRP